MSVADELMQEAWNDAVGPATRLWSGRISETDQAKFPNAGYTFTGYSDDDSPLSESLLEKERYSISVAHTNRRALWSMARKLRASINRLDHEKLADAEAKIGDFAIPQSEAGKPLWYELTLDVTFSLWNQED